ncbi:response regulator [Clostridium sp. SYSU_GA19001]|uniref:response regulator transcription factor n=1 Tax=Clostridium caldaquaticum TaxID=2940653 RepID=UPI0020777826|nr:response regulator [Clostridium caldaquaticum]MCM8711896.1 response regulator [Clostridium caldaquaticum]
MYKFIVVDDERLIRKGILKKIEKLDLEIELAGEAENGEEAIELIEKVKPHIILTDMRMPLMDGKALLKKLQQDYPEIKIIVISGYSDFEYLQEAISANVVDYILKPFNKEEIYKSFTKAINSIDKELSATKKLEQIETEFDINYLSDLITSCQTVYDSGYFKSTKIKTLKNFHSFLLLSIYSPEKSSKDIYENMLTFSNFAENCVLIPGSSKINLCFVLYAFNNESNGEISAFVKKQGIEIYEHLKSLSFSNMYLSFSSITADLSLINNCYLESLEALNKRDVRDNFYILIYDNYEISPVESDWDKIDTLVFFIEAGNERKVLELINEFFNTLENISPLTLVTIKYNCLTVFRSIRNMLKDHYDILKKYSFTNDYEAILNNNFDYNKIKSSSIQMLSRLTSMFKDKNVYPSEELIENIKKYIKKNYSNDINLEKISSLFFLNPSYLSFLFKEKTGENLIDFVNKVRIEKAKELLKTTDYKIYKIAKMLGFDNDKYFFRVFKKLSGYTPEKYRIMEQVK